jgi:hypothetical protein
LLTETSAKPQFIPVMSSGPEPESKEGANPEPESDCSCSTECSQSYIDSDELYCGHGFPRTSHALPPRHVWAPCVVGVWPALNSPLAVESFGAGNVLSGQQNPSWPLLLDFMPPGTEGANEKSAGIHGYVWQWSLHPTRHVFVRVENLRDGETAFLQSIRPAPPSYRSNWQPLQGKFKLRGGFVESHGILDDHALSHYVMRGLQRDAATSLRGLRRCVQKGYYRPHPVQNIEAYYVAAVKEYVSNEWVTAVSREKELYFGVFPEENKPAHHDEIFTEGNQYQFWSHTCSELMHVIGDYLFPPTVPYSSQDGIVEFALRKLTVDKLTHERKLNICIRNYLHHSRRMRVGMLGMAGKRAEEERRQRRAAMEKWESNGYFMAWQLALDRHDLTILTTYFDVQIYQVP